MSTTGMAITTASEATRMSDWIFNVLWDAAIFTFGSRWIYGYWFWKAGK